MSILTLLVIVLVVALLFGGFGQTRNWGPQAWSPVGIVLVVLLLLFLFGHIH